MILDVSSDQTAISQSHGHSDDPPGRRRHNPNNQVSIFFIHTLPLSPTHPPTLIHSSADEKLPSWFRSRNSSEDLFNCTYGRLSSPKRHRCCCCRISPTQNSDSSLCKGDVIKIITILMNVHREDADGDHMMMYVATLSRLGGPMFSSSSSDVGPMHVTLPKALITHTYWCGRPSNDSYQQGLLLGVFLAGECQCWYSPFDGGPASIIPWPHQKSQHRSQPKISSLHILRKYRVGIYVGWSCWSGWKKGRALQPAAPANWNPSHVFPKNT